MKKFMLIVASIFATLSAAAQTSYVLLAPGFEEVEALTTINVLRRANMDVVTVAVADQQQVTGATGITIKADSLITEVNTDNAEWIILPGGEDGAKNLRANATVTDILLKQAEGEGGIAAICSAPALVLAPLDILDGRIATCYPGLEGALIEGGCDYERGTVIVDDDIITSAGPGTTMAFAMEIVRASKGRHLADAVAQCLLK